DSTRQTPLITTVALYDSFGTETHKFNLKKFKLQPNGSLYDVLKKLDFTPTQIYKIAQKAKPVVDFRAFRPGQKFRAYFSKTHHSLEKLIWQPDALQYVTFSWMGDSL